MKYRSIDTPWHEDNVFDVPILKHVVRNCPKLSWFKAKYLPGEPMEKFKLLREGVDLLQKKYHYQEKPWMIACGKTLENMYDHYDFFSKEPKYVGTVYGSIKVYQCDSLGEWIALFGAGETLKTTDDYTLLWHEHLTAYRE